MHAHIDAAFDTLGQPQQEKQPNKILRACHEARAEYEIMVDLS